MSKESYPCLGLEFLGQCHYDPTNPIVYFSIGQLIPLFIIIIALYKLLSPITLLRIESRKWVFFPRLRLPHHFQWIEYLLKQRVYPLFLSVFLSICFVFLSNIIPSIPGFYKIPVLGYPIFWELLAGIFLTYSGYKIFRHISQPAILDKDNYQVFFEKIQQIIDRRDEAELISLAKEITASLKRILFIARSSKHRYMRCRTLASEKYSVKNKDISTYQLDKLINSDEELRKQAQLTEEELCCYHILDLLSDISFCNIIARKVPQFFEEFMSSTTINSVLEVSGNFIFSNIMKSSFEHEDSILNRENQIDGLSGVSHLTDLVFKNPHFLQIHSFTNLISLIRRIEFKEEWQIKLYFSCLKKSLELSFDVTCSQTLDHIFSGLYQLKEITSIAFFRKIF